ncbi:MAG TPA: penicillin-binding protein 2 [Actinomycetota bacterium]|nr:penicillin-binding protein 2 [Actinomycetota bacterium]
MKALNQGLDRIHVRVAVIGIVFLSLVAALVLRLWFLQVLSATAATRQAVANVARPVPDPALRGSILDRNGQPLANNVASQVVLLDRSRFEIPAPTAANRNAMAVTAQGEIVLGRLSKVLGIPIPQLVANLNNVNADPFAPIPVATNVSQDAVIYIKEHQATGDQLFPGVTAVEQPVRSYPNGAVAANILGYVGRINSSDLSKPSYKGDAANSIVGESGLEYQYEHYLHGTDGVTEQEVDSSGNVVGTLSTQNPIDGDNLVTSINLQIQQNAEASLAMGLQAAQSEVDPTNGKKYPAVAGSAIVLDPNNGQVLAMASYPDFNPNDFVGGISPTEYKQLTSNPNDPLINRAIQAASAPGSTFKVVTAGAALSTGVATANGNYQCPTSVRDYNQTFDNFEPTTDPSISVAQAIVQSCDTVFYQFGQAFYQRYDSSTGGTVLSNYAQEFGFTKDSGIDLPAEQSGVVGTPAYVAKYPSDFPYGWEPGYDIQEAIGQGPMAVTPIQVADAYAAIANGGTLYQPQIAMRIANPTTGQVVKSFSPVVAAHLPVSPANLAVIQQGLEGVVADSSGTAYAAFSNFPLAQFPIAGKTGTADVGVNGTLEPYAWFASYAPANNPQYVVVVMLDQGGFGAQTAAPIAKRIYQGIFGVSETAIGQGTAVTG